MGHPLLADAYPNVHLAIDPGTTTGWSVYDAVGMLVSCGIGKPPHPKWFRKGVLIERPRIYPKGRTRNPNDILSVAINAGEWAGLYRAWGCPVEYVEPFQWKGKLSKDVHHRRILAKLTAQERQIVDEAKVASSKRHNMIDAVGLGLYKVGRVER